MNESHIRQIFANYIKKFDLLNGPVHQEYFKWQVAKQFRPMMDDALSSSDEAFPQKLSNVKKMTSLLIDNANTYPFNGLVQCSKKAPVEVREMFSDLFLGDNPLQTRIYNFLVRSHAMQGTYIANSYKYKSDVHSVTAYLAMYDPDNHYIYRPTESREFADYVEFYDDWGSGDTVKLDVYYRMCDQLVDAINRSEELLATNARLFTGELGIHPETLYSDPRKHILAWDLIYCCSSSRYNLFHGITASKKTPTERKEARERQDRMERQYQELSAELSSMRDKLRAFEEAKGYLSEVFSVGSLIMHKTFGKGEVTGMEDDSRSGLLISVRFDKVGTKRFVLHTTIKGNFLFPTSGEGEYVARIEAYKDGLILFEHTRMESLQKSIADTEQAIKALGKISKAPSSHNIQQSFTPPPKKNLALLTKHTIRGAKRTHRRFCRAFFFALHFTILVSGL